MKFYFCARYERRVELIALADSLEKKGYEVNCGWLRRETAPTAASLLENLDDLAAADFVIALTEAEPEHFDPRPRPELRHAEMSFAIAAGKPVMFVGPYEHLAIFSARPVDDLFAPAHVATTAPVNAKY